MARNKGSLGVGVNDAEVEKMLQALNKMKGKDNEDMSMYSVLPKRTFERKKNPPYGLKVFKVKLFSCYLRAATCTFFLYNCIMKTTGTFWVLNTIK
jgi:hypothetical protein